MWKVGETVVFIRGHKQDLSRGVKALLSLGEKREVQRVIPNMKCTEHGPIQYVDVGTPMIYCARCFRKPINFNTYLSTVVNQKEPQHGR